MLARRYSNMYTLVVHVKCRGFLPPHPWGIVQMKLSWARRFLGLAHRGGEHRCLGTPQGPPSVPIRCYSRGSDGQKQLASKQNKLICTVECEVCGCTEPPCQVGCRKTSPTALCKVTGPAHSEGNGCHVGCGQPDNAASLVCNYHSAKSLLLKALCINLGKNVRRNLTFM